MSEQENVKVVEQAYAAYLRGDMESLLDSLSETVEWIALEIEPVAGTYRGKGEVAQFFERIRESAEFSSFEPREYIAQNDRVVVLGNYTGTARKTGRPFQSDWAMVFTVTDGKISRFQEFADTAALSVALSSASTAAA